MYAPAEKAETHSIFHLYPISVGDNIRRFAKTHLDEIGERLSGQNPVLDALLLLAHAHQAGQHPVQDDPLVVCQCAAPVPGNTVQSANQKEGKYSIRSMD